jgi:hypothetical protein
VTLNWGDLLFYKNIEKEKNTVSRFFQDPDLIIFYSTITPLLGKIFRDFFQYEIHLRLVPKYQKIAKTFS